MINIIIDSDMFSCNVIMREKEAQRFIEKIAKLYFQHIFKYNYLHCKFEKL